MACSWEKPPAAPGAHVRLWATLASFKDDEGLELDFAEVFAGNKAVTRGLHALGYRGCALDMRYHPGMDVLTPSGVIMLLSTVLALKPGGLLWAAPPCSTWVFMSRSTFGRDIQVEGNGLERTNAQNALVERLVLALEICTLLGSVWIIEQPTSSLMWEYPAMRALLRRHNAVEVRLDMGAFGADSQKPTVLMGTAPYLRAMERRCAAEEKLMLRLEGAQTTVQYTDSKGKKRCQGTAELKATQQYPEGLGAVHALAFKEYYGPASSDAATPASSDAGTPASDAGAKRRRKQTRAEKLNKAVHALPEEVKVAVVDAWWLRDLLKGGRQWEVNLPGELKVEALT